MVGVALQQLSVGGTVMVVVESQRHIGTGPQVLGLNVFVPEHAIVMLGYLYFLRRGNNVRKELWVVVSV